jgi:hypothetical protein
MITNSTRFSQSLRSNSEERCFVEYSTKKLAEMDEFLLLKVMFKGTSHSPEDALQV